MAGYYYSYDFTKLGTGVTYEVIGLSEAVTAAITAADAEKAQADADAFAAFQASGFTQAQAYQDALAANTAKCNATKAALNAMPANFASNSYTAASSFSVVDGTLCAFAANATPVVGKSVLVGKVKLTIPESIDSIDVPCTLIQLSTGDDNKFGRTGDVTDQAILSKLSMKLGAGAKSDITTTVGTWTGGGSYDVVNFVPDHDAHTLTATIPAEWPTEYIEYSFTTDGGKGSAVMQAGTGVDTANNKIKVPAKNGTTTATLAVTAQDGTTTQNYSVKVVRRSSDITALTLKGDGTESYSLSDFNYNANDNIYTMKSGTQVKWNNTAVSLAISLADKNTQTLKIDSKPASHNSGVSYNLGSTSTSDTPHSITFDVTEYGYTTTYTVEFERAKGSSDTTISGIKVWTDNEGSPLVLTGPMDESGVDVYTISTNVKSNFTSLNFKVSLTNKDTQTIIYDGNNWDGTSGKQFSSTGTDNGTDGYDFFMTFEVKPQVGTSKVYKVVGTRDYKKNTSTDVTGTWEGDDSANSVALVVNPTAKTITGTLPANFSSSTVTVSLVTDGGLGSNTISGTGWSGNTLTVLPAPGSSSMATVVSTAEDGDTEVTYTLTLSRRASDYSNVTLYDGSTSHTMNSSNYDADNKTYELTASKFAWNSTSADLSVKLADASVQSLYIDGDLVSSVAKKSKDLGAPDTDPQTYTYTFIVKEADGTFNEYKVKFTRAAGSGEAGINGITVWYTSESSPFTVTGPNGSNEYQIEELLKFAYKTIKFKVQLKDSTATITYDGDNTWKGTTAKDIQTGDPNNTEDEDTKIDDDKKTPLNSRKSEMFSKYFLFLF